MYFRVYEEEKIEIECEKILYKKTLAVTKDSELLKRIKRNIEKQKGCSIASECLEDLPNVTGTNAIYEYEIPHEKTKAIPLCYVAKIHYIAGVMGNKPFYAPKINEQPTEFKSILLGLKHYEPQEELPKN